MTSIAIFAHSTNPRGGVVHAMQLAEALCVQGHDATLLAPGSGRFFRTPRCPWIVIPAIPAPRNVEMLVETRRQEIAGFLRSPEAPRFDLLHAQDSISALSLSDLVEQGCIPFYLRTVHHLDEFANPRLAAWQDRAVHDAIHLFCVSRLWQEELRRRFGRKSTWVGNGIDTDRFTPGPAESALRRRLLPQGGRIVLAIGGIEARKNILGTLRAFLQLADEHPDLHLLIAGGASLLDHARTRLLFDELVRRSRHANRIIHCGVIDDADMPALYRICNMLCFPSLQEGFGLCVLEAMASGIPVIAPQAPPFDEYLEPDDAIPCNPACVASIAAAMREALSPARIDHARRHGPARARRFAWQDVASRHAGAYHRLLTELTLHA